MGGRIIILVTALVILFCHTSSYGLQLEVKDTTGTTGTNVTVEVDLVDNIDELDSFGMVMSYDSTKLTYKSVAKCGLTEDFNYFDGRKTETGKVRIGGLASEASSGSGCVVKVTFKISTDASGTCEIGLSEFVDDFQGAEADNGTIEIEQGAGGGGCIAEKLLESEKGADILRAYRDMVMIKSAWGAELIRLYYEFQGEAGDVISGDAKLRSKARKLLLEFLPYLGNIVKGKDVTIGNARIDEIETFLSDVIEKTDGESKKAVQELLHSLRDTGLLSELGIRVR